MRVSVNGEAAGIVTSGCVSPTLGYPIAMAYLPRETTAEGSAVEVDLGGGTDATIVPLPFYKRPRG